MILSIAAGLWVFRLVSSPLWDSKIARLELWLCKASKEIRLEVYRRSEMKQSTILLAFSLESTFSKEATLCDFSALCEKVDSKVCVLFVWITKEAAASPCFAAPLLAQCLASERKRVLFQKWILGLASPSTPLKVHLHRDIISPTFTDIVVGISVVVVWCASSGIALIIHKIDASPSTPLKVHLHRDIISPTFTDIVVGISVVVVWCASSGIALIIHKIDIKEIIHRGIYA